MKKINTVSIIAMACAMVVASPSFGASSVRTIGGAGTYTSAASASNSTSGSAATSGGAAAVRAGSLRVTPTTGKTGTTTSVSSNASTAASGRAASPRLSVGRYLGASTSTTTSGSTRPGAAGSSATGQTQATIDEMQAQIDEVQRQIDSLHSKDDELTAALDEKQNQLTGDDYIDVTDDTVSLNLESLRAELSNDVEGALSNYYSKTDIDGKLAEKMNLPAGDGLYLARKAGWNEVTIADATAAKDLADAITGAVK